jgi:hypothetical protein
VIAVVLLLLMSQVAWAVDPNDPISQPLQVFLLAGQSNMAGTGVSSEISSPLSDTRLDVWFWGDNEIGWQALEPNLAEWPGLFGPELLIGNLLADQYPSQQIALVKHAVTSTNLAYDWDPNTPGEQYEDWVDKVDTALADLTSSGYSYEIKGIFWRQGERDSRFAAMAAAYEDNFTNFVTAVRDEFGDVPLVFGRIKGPTDTNPTWLNQVRAAQTDVAADVDDVYMVNTDAYHLIDDCHYNTRGHIMQGTAMVAAYLGEFLEYAEIDNPAFEDGLTGWTSAGSGNYDEEYEDIQVYAPTFDGWDDHCAVVGYGESSVSSLKQTLDGNTPAVLKEGRMYTMEVRVGRPGGDSGGYSNEYGWKVAMETEDGNLLAEVGFGDVSRIDPYGWYVAELQYECMYEDPLAGQHVVVALYHDDPNGKGSGIYDDVVLGITRGSEDSNVVNHGFESGTSGWVSSGAGNGDVTFDVMDNYCAGFDGWGERAMVVGYGEYGESSMKQTMDGNNGSEAVQLAAGNLYRTIPHDQLGAQRPQRPGLRRVRRRGHADNAVLSQEQRL